MSAPERIWVDFFNTDFEGITCMDVAGVPFLSAIEYVRADIASAQVAAAIEDVVAEKNPSPRATAAFLQIAAAIRALTPEAPK